MLIAAGTSLLRGKISAVSKAAGIGGLAVNAVDTAARYAGLKDNPAEKVARWVDEHSESVSRWIKERTGLSTPVFANPEANKSSADIHATGAVAV